MENPNQIHKVINKRNSVQLEAIAVEHFLNLKKEE